MLDHYNHYNHYNHNKYTKERIKERITEKALAKEKKCVPFPTRKKPIVKDYSRKNLTLSVL